MRVYMRGEEWVEFHIHTKLRIPHYTSHSHVVH